MHQPKYIPWNFCISFYIFSLYNFALVSSSFHLPNLLGFKNSAFYQALVFCTLIELYFFQISYSKLIKYSGSKNMAYILKDLSANAFLKTSIVCFNIHWNSKLFLSSLKKDVDQWRKNTGFNKSHSAKCKNKKYFPPFFLLLPEEPQGILYMSKKTLKIIMWKSNSSLGCFNVFLSTNKKKIFNLLSWHCLKSFWNKSISSNLKYYEVSKNNKCEYLCKFTYISQNTTHILLDMFKNRVFLISWDT